MDVWHQSAGLSLTSGEVVSWTGQKAGIALVPANSSTRPPYGADGGAWGGKSVVQTTSASRGLRAVGVATGLLSGTRPWTFSRFRFRTAPSGSDFMVVDYGVDATSDLVSLGVRADGALRGTINNALSGPRAIAAAVTNTAAHSAEVWADGTNINLAVDGAATVDPNTAALNADVTSVGIGQTATGAYWFSNVSHAVHLICYAYPGAAAVAAVRALALAEFPA